LWAGCLESKMVWIWLKHECASNGLLDSSCLLKIYFLTVAVHAMSTRCIDESNNDVTFVDIVQTSDVFPGTVPGRYKFALHHVASPPECCIIFDYFDSFHYNSFEELSSLRLCSSKTRLRLFEI
jgi:hypothetical protein